MTVRAVEILDIRKGKGEGSASFILVQEHGMGHLSGVSHRHQSLLHIVIACNIRKFHQPYFSIIFFPQRAAPSGRSYRQSDGIPQSSAIWAGAYIAGKVSQHLPVTGLRSSFMAFTASSISFQFLFQHNGHRRALHENP